MRVLGDCPKWRQQPAGMELMVGLRPQMAVACGKWQLIEGNNTKKAGPCREW